MRTGHGCVGRLSRTILTVGCLLAGWALPAAAADLDFPLRRNHGEFRVSQKFGQYIPAMSGFHPGEDWSYEGGDNSRRVYSLGDGVVVLVGYPAAGPFVIIRHDGPFVIPRKVYVCPITAQTYTYAQEVVQYVYVVYARLANNIQVAENQLVTRDTWLGVYADYGGGAHLHLEVRHPDTVFPIDDWRFFGVETNQAPGIPPYNGYYLNLQQMVTPPTGGVKEPASFIYANSPRAVSNAFAVGANVPVAANTDLRYYPAPWHGTIMVTVPQGQQVTVLAATDTGFVNGVAADGFFWWFVRYVHPILGTVDAWAPLAGGAPVIDTVSTPAVPNGPATGYVNTTYMFNTGESTCSEGHPVRYRYDWGDGTFSNWSPATTGSHRWNTPGVYQVRAQARCAVNPTAVSAWSPAFDVTILPPHSVSRPNVPAGPTLADEGVNCDYTVDGSVCSEGHPVEYSIDWGDGTPPSPWAAPGAGSHAWATGGLFQVKARARCTVDNNIVSPWSQELAVMIIGAGSHWVNPPDLPTGPKSGMTGIPYSHAAAGAWCNQGHPVEYRFDWGDGNFSAWGPIASAIHAWAIPGLFQVRAQARCVADNTVESAWSGPKLMPVSQSPPIVSVAAAPQAGAETAPGDPPQTATFRISRNIVNGPLPVAFGLGGTAKLGADYTMSVNGTPLAATTAVIPAGQAFVDVTLWPVDDFLAEGVEWAEMTLKSAKGYMLDPAAANRSDWALILDKAQPTPAQIEAAVAWAEAIEALGLEFAKKKKGCPTHAVGLDCYYGLAFEFVWRAYAWTAGQGQGLWKGREFKSAADAAARLAAGGNAGNVPPPRGAWVFYNVLGSKTGHAALSLGGGNVIHVYTPPDGSNGKAEVRPFNLQAVYPQMTYIGWAWPSCSK